MQFKNKLELKITLKITLKTYLQITLSAFRGELNAIPVAQQVGGCPSTHTLQEEAGSHCGPGRELDDCPGIHDAG